MATREGFNQEFSEICRLCLKQEDVMESIFQTIDGEDTEFSLAQRISTIARVQVHEDDGLPTLICGTCRHQVEKSYNFRLLVEISDRTLRNCLEGPQVETSEQMIKQELSDPNVDSADEENVGLEHFFLDTNLTESDIDPRAINVILVQSEDGTRVLNICSINDSQDTENLEGTASVKNEYSVSSEQEEDATMFQVLEQDERRSEPNDLEDNQQLTSPKKIYLQDLEPQLQSVHPCNKCDKFFSTDEDLDTHFTIGHEDDNEYLDTSDIEIRCQLCFDAFESLEDLKNHVIEHFANGRRLSTVKSETYIPSAGEEMCDVIETITDNDSDYVLGVPKSEEAEVITQNHYGNKITGPTVEDGLIEISIDNISEHSSQPNSHKDGDSLDVELELGLDNNTEYQSDIFYCVGEYLPDLVKVRSTGNFPCTQCDKTFTQKHEQTLHLRRHLGVKPFKCTSCDETFITNALRKEHERGHTGEKGFVCVVCGKSFVKKSELKYHEGVHTDTPSTCNICNKEFTNVQSLKMHTKRHILGSRYVCETCGKSYYTNSELARHVQMHSGKREYPCHLCETSFLSRPELNRHLRYHIGEKTFRCKICFKSYFESGHLKIHERVHTGEKPYVCTVCNKAFVTKPKLVRHQKIHAKEQIMKCDINDQQQIMTEDT
ncbi:zinc finger protein 2 homolog isoform X2 [Diprion similis]|uniref:zinc finger protein 2 homolog isoform X2 n=1 Tax=Diprion similis TaxID=362088 RepID=UPI001EF802E2|nr:zinc finger protein 2 homolog isoform X2 [Diprion similis]